MPIGAGRLGYWFHAPSVPDPDVPQPQFPNLGFEQGFTGWNISATRIQMGGGSTLAGWPTPVDPLPNPYYCTGDATYVAQLPSFTYRLELVDKPPLGEVQSCFLSLGTNVYGVVNEGALMYGPAIYSTFSVTFNAGDQCSFDWKAVPVEDAYNVYAYMVEKDTGNYITLLREAGQNKTDGTTWTTTTVNVPTSGNYYFVFVSGSWDSTLGTVISGSMLIDNIRRIPIL